MAARISGSHIRVKSSRILVAPLQWSKLTVNILIGSAQVCGCKNGNTGIVTSQKRMDFITLIILLHFSYMYIY